MYEELMKFLHSEECFIEAEGKKTALNDFIKQYNRDYSASLTLQDDGIIFLKEDANKWGLELRLYVRTCPPDNVKRLGFTHNETYRNDFSYRLNSKQIVSYLFRQGYRIGFNEV